MQRYERRLSQSYDSDAALILDEKRLPLDAAAFYDYFAGSNGSAVGLIDAKKIKSSSISDLNPGDGRDNARWVTILCHAFV